MLTATKKTALNVGNSLFDFQTEATDNFKHDITITPQGQLARVIGVDKLAQHINKFVMVRKGSYSNPNIGTDIHNSGIYKTDVSVKTDIIRSLTEYSKAQVERSKNNFPTLLGWDVYRTQTPLDNATWTKLNKYTIKNNFYFDNKNLFTNETYYYAVVPVFTRNDKPVSEDIVNTVGVEMPQTDTYNAMVSSSLVVVPQRKAVTIYWQKQVLPQNEEILRSLTKLDAWFSPGEPRQLNLAIQATNANRSVTSVNVNTI